MRPRVQARDQRFAVERPDELQRQDHQDDRGVLDRQPVVQILKAQIEYGQGKLVLTSFCSALREHLLG